MAVMLQILQVFSRVSCLGSARAVQCPLPGPKIGDKSQQIPSYSPLCPWDQPPRMAADKCIKQWKIKDKRTRNELKTIGLWGGVILCHVFYTKNWRNHTFFSTWIKNMIMISFFVSTAHNMLSYMYIIGASDTGILQWCNFAELN